MELIIRNCACTHIDLLALCQLWRVNRCLRHKTSKIELWRMLWPSALLMGIVVILLAYTTGAGDFGWERVVIDDVTGESLGRCTSEFSQFWVYISIVNLVPLCLRGLWLTGRFLSCA
jgi:hypothetical protein